MIDAQHVLSGLEIVENSNAVSWMLDCFEMWRLKSPVLFSLFLFLFPCRFKLTPYH